MATTDAYGALYCVSAQPPTSVSHSVIGQFLSSPDEQSSLALVISRGCLLETYRVLSTEDNPSLSHSSSAYLHKVHSTSVYGNILLLERFPSRQSRGETTAASTRDWLFLCTDRHQCCCLRWNANGWVTEWTGNIQERFGRLVPALCSIDPQCRAIATYTYQGLIKVYPMNHPSSSSSSSRSAPFLGGSRPRKVLAKGKEPRFSASSSSDAANDSSLLGELLTFRIEELNVISIEFLQGTSRPTLGILYVDALRHCHFKTYVIPTSSSTDTLTTDLPIGSLQKPHVEEGTNHLIAVDQPLRGVLLVGEKSICYMNEKQTCSTVIPATCIVAHTSVDPYKFLMGDKNGMVYLLELCTAEAAAGSSSSSNMPSVRSLEWTPLGTASIATTLSYVDNGLVFVGSHVGDSQLISLPTELPMTTTSTSDANTLVTTLPVQDSLTNIAPITDLFILDSDQMGQSQVITCSGAKKDGSLRVIRSGIGIQELASIDLAEIEACFSLRPHASSMEHRYLILSFLGETRVMFLNDEDELEEIEVDGFAPNHATIYAANVGGDQWVQVTADEIRLLSATTRQLLATWKPENGEKLNCATGDGSFVFVSSGQGNLCVIQAMPTCNLQCVSNKKLPHDASCLALSLDPLNPMRGICAVGLWGDIGVRIMKFPSLEQVAKDNFGGQIDVIPRSLQFCKFGDSTYLFVALGDGKLIYYIVDAMTNQLADRKMVILGTRQIQLSPIRSAREATTIFAACDRPTLIYSDGKKLCFSAVNLKDVNHVCTFHSRVYPDALVLVDNQGLLLGTVDSVQKLHIRKIPLGEQARRICHDEEAHVYGVVTIREDVGDSGYDFERSFFRVLDEQTFDVLDSYPMGNYECVQAILVMKFGQTGTTHVSTMADRPPSAMVLDQDTKTSHFVVGTAFNIPGESEPKKGRILVFRLTANRQIQLVTAMNVKGGVFDMHAYEGMLLCCINSMVSLFELKESETGTGTELETVATHRGHIIAIKIAVRGHFILIGDIMKSMTILTLHPQTRKLEEVSRDFNPSWITALEFVEDVDWMVGADSDLNLFSLARDTGAVSEEKRKWLKMVGAFHLGEFVNHFVHGTLVMPESETLTQSSPIATPKLLFGTANGMLGILATISAESPHLRLLTNLEANLRHHLRPKSIGQFSHAGYRTFCKQHQRKEAFGFIDGDLVELFLDLSKEEQERVVLGGGGGETEGDGVPLEPLGVSVEDVMGVVEELARLH